MVRKDALQTAVTRVLASCTPRSEIGVVVDDGITPASVIGAIVLISVNGVTIETWPAFAKSITPCSIGISSVRGLLALMIV